MQKTDKLLFESLRVQDIPTWYCNHLDWPTKLRAYFEFVRFSNGRSKSNNLDLFQNYNNRLGRHCHGPTEATGFPIGSVLSSPLRGYVLYSIIKLEFLLLLWKSNSFYITYFSYQKPLQINLATSVYENPNHISTRLNLTVGDFNFLALHEYFENSKKAIIVKRRFDPLGNFRLAPLIKKL